LPKGGTLATKVLICRPADPEAKGLVERLHIEPGRIELTLVLTSPTCPMGDAIADYAWQALRTAFPQREVSVEEAQGVDWGPQRMSDAARQRLGWNDAPG